MYYTLGINKYFFYKKFEKIFQHLRSACKLLCISTEKVIMHSHLSLHCVSISEKSINFINLYNKDQNDKLPGNLKSTVEVRAIEVNITDRTRV